MVTQLNLTASNKLQNIILLFAGITYFLYGCFLGLGNHQLDVVLGFIVCVVSLSIPLLFDIRSIRLSHLIYILIGIHFSFYFGCIVSGADTEILWGGDSNLYHIPASINYKEDIFRFFSNKEYFNGRVLPIHVVTGVLFQFIGVNTFATTLSTLLFKIPVLILTEKLGTSLFDKRVGIMSALMYIFLPSVFMFSAVFFKEVSIQLYVLGFFYFFHLYSSKRNIRFLIMSLFFLMLIGYERIYIFPSIIFGVGFWFLHGLFKKKIEKRTLVFVLLICATGYLFLQYYMPILKINNIFEYIHQQREVYFGLEGVTKWNRIIPFPLTFFKILLAPFFTLNKFQSYDGILFLILWSAPFVNVLMILMFFEMIKSTVKKPGIHIPVIFSVVSFLLLLAYVRPFDARVRDSLVPIFIIYFCSFLLSSSRFKKLKNLIFKKRISKNMESAG